MKAKEIRKNRGVNFKSAVIMVLIVILFGILILLQMKDSFYNQSGGPRLAKGLSAPNFTLPKLDGQMVSLTDYRGKVVLLNIWATWCPPCVEEMPFMKKHKLSFPALTHSKGMIKGLYQTTGVPESFIIDKDRILVEKVIGPRNWASHEVIRFFRNLIRRD